MGEHRPPSYPGIKRESTDPAASASVEGDVTSVDVRAGDTLRDERDEVSRGPAASVDDGWPGPIEEPAPLFSE